MKDLLLITAYCPDDSRENILRNLVNSLTKFKNKYDIMVVSHTPVPVDIQKKVNYFLYDHKNEILTEWDLLNKPWFAPTDGRAIMSSFLSKKNTLLAMWRMMILGFGLAKNIGYTKVHQIEYDCEIIEDSEIEENSKLLGEVDSVVYFDNQFNTQEIMFGSFQSYYLPNLSEVLLKLDENNIKQIIRSSDTKSPEVLLFRELSKGRVTKKNRKLLEYKGNKFGIIDGQVEKTMNSWSVPYYDEKDENIYFVCWNTKILDGVEHQIIINKSNVINVEKTLFNHWRIIHLGHINEVKSIIVIENNQIRDTYDLSNDYEVDLFKKMSYRG